MLYKKYDKLRKLIHNMKSVVVAFSGGVDSTFLLKVACNELKEKAIAVTAHSETYPQAELEESKRLANLIGIKQIIIETRELENEDFSKNTPDRCYFCKKELFNKLISIARKENCDYVIYGNTVDDKNDFRPGQKAARELNVKAPLVEADLTKSEIRQLSKELELPTWDKSSFACLASRIPYGLEITKEKLTVIERAEEILRRRGFKQFRVRHHDTIARIEIAKENFNILLKPDIRECIVKEFKLLGFTYITLDLEGYRTGSMNIKLV